MSSLASHIRITLASASSDAVSLASDGFLNTDVVPTTSAQTTSLLQLAEHASHALWKKWQQACEAPPTRQVARVEGGVAEFLVGAGV